MDKGYEKENDIIFDLSLDDIEVHYKAEIVFNDGDTRKYDMIYYNETDYIIGEIKKIEYKHKNVERYLLFFKRYTEKYKMMDVFIETGHIKGHSVKAINCKVKKRIYYLDTNTANRTLYRIINE